MKRFLLFTWGKYEPCGGWRDLTGSFDTREEAHARFMTGVAYSDQMQIVDSATGEVVDETA